MKPASINQEVKYGNFKRSSLNVRFSHKLSTKCEFVHIQVVKITVYSKSA